ncbi:hypothetical protein [Bacillus sp. JAS24-2]|uniref:hypothetical protein n=1 Tax=Bacillus sp. JAS24-2 TaxID=2217832 RepID=UPI002107AEA2|nr:hypothetical protein [Bacillus sp. JAS24-2]
MLDSLVKDLILQLLAMNMEKERTESKRRQVQGIKITKEKGGYQGYLILYGPDARDLQK